MRLLKRTGFTLTEVLTVIIILGALMVMAIRYSQKTIEEGNEREAIIHLTAIHSANQAYKSRHGQYWPTSGSHGVSSINTNLKLNIVESGMTYTCTGNGTTFNCTAVRKAPAASFTVSVNGAQSITGTNPQCTAGACP